MIWNVTGLLQQKTNGSVPASVSVAVADAFPLSCDDTPDCGQHRVCTATILCTDCSIADLAPSIHVQFIPKGVTAAAIRVGASVPYFDPSSKGVSDRFTYQLVANIAPEATGDLLAGAVPSAVALSLTTAVRADSNSLDDENNPLGLIVQLFDTTVGSTISSRSSLVAAQAAAGVGIDIVFTQSGNSFVIQSSRTQTPLNLAAQLLALWGGAFALGVNCLVLYQWYANGPANKPAPGMDRALANSVVERPAGTPAAAGSPDSGRGAVELHTVAVSPKE